MSVTEEYRADRRAAAEWRPADIDSVEYAATDMIALRLRPAQPRPHRAGQHYEIRFPDEDLMRNYSIVSSPIRTDILEFGIKVLATGMMSRRLADAAPGDALEIRGPLGQGFPWTPEDGVPLILLGAGAGITPLLPMYDHFSASYPGESVLFLVTAKSIERIFRHERYRDAMTIRCTQREGRLDSDSISAFLEPLRGVVEANFRICGPGGFINTVVDTVLDLGFDESRVRSEAFV